MRGFIFGCSLDTGRNIYLKPAMTSQEWFSKGLVTNHVNVGFVGSLGGGKSFANNLIVYYAVLYGGTNGDCGPKSRALADGKKPCQRFPLKSNHRPLTSDGKNKGLTSTLM